MSELIEKLYAAGAENVHPKFIATVNGKREFVAEVVDEVVYLTEAGKALLVEDEGDEKKSVRRKKVVESANTDVPVSE